MINIYCYICFAKDLRKNYFGKIWLIISAGGFAHRETRIRKVEKKKRGHITSVTTPVLPSLSPPPPHRIHIAYLQMRLRLRHHSRRRA
jgi:hypothetical protein